MNNYNLKIEKVIAALPSTLTANTLYIVRAGAGVDLYVTDMTGSVAHKHNGVSQTVLDQIGTNTTDISTLFNTLKTLGEQNIWSVCDRPMTVNKGSATKFVYNSNDEFFRITGIAFTSNENQITLSGCLVDNTGTTLVLNEDYTLSFDLKALSSPGTFTVLTQLGSSTTNTSPAMTATTSWTPYEFTFKATGTGTTSTFSILINSTNGWTNTGGYDIRRVRLQKGTKGSGYNKSLPLILNSLNSKLDSNTFTSFRSHVENSNTKLVALGADSLQDTWICDYTKVSIDADTSARGGYITRAYSDFGAYIRTKEIVAFDDKKLYKLTFRAKIICGATGNPTNFGVETLHRDKITYITKTNTTTPSIGSGSYISVVTNNGPQAEYVLYIKGRGATSGSGNGTLNDPLVLPAQTAWISPIIYVNSASATQIYTDYAILEEVDTFYSAGSGISITNGVVANTNPNATHTGEVTGSGALTITPGAVTFTKIQNIPTKTLIGRYSSGSSSPESISIGSGLDINSSGVLNTVNNGTVTSVGMTVPTGLQVTGSPIVSSGTLSVTYGAGYQGFLTSDKNKLDGIQAGAEVNVNPDWTAISGDSQILNKPTTISGYGITDAVTSTSSYDNPSWLNTLAWSKITGKPSTISGYGITDAANISHNHTVDSLSNVVITNKSSNDLLRWDGVSWVNSTVGSAGIAAINQTMYIGTTALAINRASAALSLTGVNIDGNAGTVTNGVYTNGVYSNPSWISSIAWPKITNLPTTLSGYGITDGVTTTGSYSNPSWLSSLSWSKITGSTTLGSNLVTLVNPSSVTFLRVNADNTVSALDAASFRTAIGAGTSSTTGTVTSVNLTVPVGLSVTGGPITTSGALALSYASGYQGFLITDKTKLDGIEVGANNYILPTGTSSTLGGNKLFSDVSQTVASNAVSSVASRTYGIQNNASGQLVVNVPWVDTNTTYTNGSGLGLSGTTFSVNFGTTTGTVTEGNDARVINGQTAYSWGNHASVGYSLNTHNHSLDSLNNVTITSNTVGELLRWTGSAWVNSTLAEAGIQPVGSYITTSQKGVANGVASLDSNGLIPNSQLPSYVDDVLEYANLSSFPITGEAGKIYIALDTNKTYRWSGTVYVYITSGAVDSVAGKTGIVTLTSSDVGLSNVNNTADSVKNVLSATKLTTARTLTYSGDLTGSSSFDGSANTTTTLTLANSGATAGSYGSTTSIPGISVNSKGLVTGITTYNIPSSTTTTPGLVQLNDTLTSTSNTLALTAAQGKNLQDTKAPIDNPIHTGTNYNQVLKLERNAYPRLEFAPNTGGANGAIIEVSDSGYPYIAVRPKVSLGSSAGQVALFSFPTSKTGGHTVATLSDLTTMKPVPTVIDSYSAIYKNIASYISRSATVSGAIVIHLPVAKSSSNSMLKMDISGYNYATESSWDLTIAGYNYTGNTWVNTSANLTKAYSQVEEVKFGQASDHQVIIIGKFNASGAPISGFNYPRIYIKELSTSYTSPLNWNSSDFTISIESDISAYTINSTRAVGNIVATSGTFTGDITSSGNIIASQGLSVELKGNSNMGNGISLYGGSTGSTGALPSFGISFAGTATYGTHGGVSGDWATYFTLGGASNRGWVFKSNSTSSSGNVASISSSGVFTGSSFVGPLTGNATTATALQTARNINGVSFDGTANITVTDSTKVSLTGAVMTGSLTATNIGTSNTSNTSGTGISLYGNAQVGMPGYGLAFSGTATFGTHGAVTSDWATYFTMSGATSRGWIFKAGNGAGGNVASISATGIVTANSFVGNLTGSSTSLSTATGTAPSYSARAWVYFDASSGTPVIKGSSNVSSIVDNRVGDYTINFTTAMPDEFYAVSGTVGNADLTAAPAAASVRVLGTPTASSVRVKTANHFINSGAAAYDMPYVSIIIFR